VTSPAGEPSGKISRQHRFASETLSRIIDACSIPSFVIDQQHRVTHWNTAMTALTKIRAEDVVGTDGQWRAFYGERRPVMADMVADGANLDEMQSLYGRRCHKSQLIEGAFEAESFFRDLSDSGRWLRFTASPIKDRKGALIGVIETMEDITRRRTAEENFRYYMAATTRAQEEERKRIARELHDDTVQLMASLSREVDVFLRSNRGLQPDAVSFMRDIQGKLNTGAKSVHRFSQALRLSLLDDFGLVPALRSLVTALREGDRGEAELEVIGEERRLAPEIETAIFRIVQEALNNVRKYAQPCDTTVYLEFTDDAVSIKVSDNGTGFRMVDDVQALPRKGKLGLAGINERVRLLGGRFNVTSAVGKGTTLNARIPVGDRATEPDTTA
jgi:two-component system, NarL family, sensor histidine kinase DegS